MSDLRRLVPKGKLGTPQTVIEELLSRQDDIQEIYVVTKEKSGVSYEYISGDLQGLTFALLYLQDVAIQALNGKWVGGKR